MRLFWSSFESISPMLKTLKNQNHWSNPLLQKSTVPSILTFLPVAFVAFYRITVLVLEFAARFTVYDFGAPRVFILSCWLNGFPKEIRIWGTPPKTSKEWIILDRPSMPFVSISFKGKCNFLLHFLMLKPNVVKYFEGMHGTFKIFEERCDSLHVHQTLWYL